MTGPDTDTPTGILLTAFGGPDSLDAVGPFMARLMGREPSVELVERAQGKYRAIGGGSPLQAIATSIATGLEAELSSRGRDTPVRTGMCYWDPYIADAMRELSVLGAERVIMVSLSPFESKVACGAYRKAAAEAAAGMELTGVCEAPALHASPQFREFLGHALVHALEAVPGSTPLVVMTAHSLPVADLAEDDPYVTGLTEVADAVAAYAGLGEACAMAGDERLPGIETFGALDGVAPWVFAYQSKGARPGAWLGPDLREVLEAASRAGYDSVVVCPVGFATDHMETLYDLDIVAEESARSLGLGFVRSRVPNEDHLLIEGLADLVEPLL